MKILFCIPHYYDEARYPKGRFQGSSGASPRSARRQAVADTIVALHATFGPAQFGLSHRRVEAHPANQRIAATAIEVALCVVGDRHLAHELPIPPDLCVLEPCECAPMLLGFECQRLMADRLGQFDWYVFLEDDLVIDDPFFFAKLAWFRDTAGEDAVLQANRFEAGPGGPAHKLYLDWDVRAERSQPFHDRADRRELRIPHLGLDLVFRRPLNPHSGFFAVSNSQLRHWVSRPWFLDRDCRFIGPGESSATLGVLRTFRLYKPGIENAGFLELRHPGAAFRALLGGKVRVVPDRASLLE